MALISSALLVASKPTSAAKKLTNDSVLYRGERTLVLRRHSPGAEPSLIVKQAVGPEALKHLRHERSVLQRLRGIDGVSRLASASWPEDTLVLHDDGGVTLASAMTATPMELEDTLAIGLALSRVLIEVHRRGVVHKDINPTNILLAGLERRPVLIDFNIAIMSGDDGTSLGNESRFAGTLAFMPPEQTGRTGRQIDQRSDLYALGAVLYRLATGKALFEADDLLDVLQLQLTTTPAAPADLVPGLPQTFSDLLMRLLEKEPDHRYQSAEGVAHDLERLVQAHAFGDTTPFTLGIRDFAARLLPSSPLERQRELAALQSELAAACSGRASCVLVSGGAGVGKTMLVHQLKAAVAERGGWFVSGRSDTHHSEKASATVQALTELGKLLLSQPEDKLVPVRERMRRELGLNLSTGITRITEFKLLLGDPDDISADPVTANRGSVEGTVSVIRAVVSHQRPMVMLLDDAHLTPEVWVRFIDLVLAARAELPGFVLVLAYRPQDLDNSSPLRAGLARWAALDDSPAQVALETLSLDSISALVGTMLRLGPHEATRLAAVLNERTQGNPQDTVELINALRQDGLLEPGAAGWHWDEQTIRRFVGENDSADLLNRRLSKLPPACLSLMETLACLGKEVPLSLLNAAADPALGDAQSVLAPAIDDGLLVVDIRDTQVITFRNPRVAECIQSQLDGSAMRELRLALARRLAASTGHDRQAAQQYINALPDVSAPAERRRAAELLQAAALAAQVSNAEASERFAKAAIAALLPIEEPQDAERLRSLRVLQHLVFYGLGRHDEADAVYAAITARCTDPFVLAEPAGVQLASLSNRDRNREAVALGLHVLQQLGVSLPQDVDAAVNAGMKTISTWAADPVKSEDLVRPEATGTELLVLIKFLKRLLAPTYHDRSLHGWLLLQCHRLWVAHGPSSALMSTIGSLAAFMAVKLKDYQGAYATARHAITVGETRGYEPATSMARYLSALSVSHWVEPIEETLALIRSARHGLIPANEVQHAANTFSVGVFLLIESASTLNDVSNEIDQAAAFEQRTGHHSSDPITRSYRQFVRAMQGETDAAGSFNDASFNEAQFLAQTGVIVSAPTMMHTLRAMSALVFNDPLAMHRHASAALSSAGTTTSFYASVPPHWCQGVSLAERIRADRTTATAALLAELDGCHEWLVQRATDAPANFSHMASLLDAERAWALGQTWVAGAAYERALSEAGGRPWHRAVIGERAARFYFAHGWDLTGRPFLQEALRGFEEWGAAGKVRALLAEFPFLRNVIASRRLGTSGRSTTASSETVDMMAVLRASQALSSETSLASLNACVAKVLGAMCGATSVLMVVRPLEQTGWFLATSLEQNGAAMSVEEAGAQGLLSLSAFRYAERTRQPLLLEDAASDPRFSADLALAGLKHCSLLFVPILKQGEMQAVLVLENRMRHSAFSADRLDAVTLIAGQLAVSLDNALLYASLESKVAERTAALEEANRKLEQLSVTDALTGLANRRHFNQALDVEWQRAQRTGTPVGLAMIDIDQFKQYNDHYGHQGGDTCLQLVAEAMKTGLRAGTNLLARYGGEEFVLLLRDSDLAGTHACAERVRAAVAAKMEPHVKAMHGMVTISIGIASCVPTAEVTPAQGLEIADAALYRAKDAGRNRVARPD